ncbi:aspartate aminotransferase protein [Rutstroemia sp. NJR-2017a WRK4]|nr:aspartate aminotransferase protein [Rutstroemia sp. NJR-2017a WRK4]
MSLFDVLPFTPPDSAFSLIAAFAADESPQKVNLCPGFYRDEQARPWVLPSVQKAKEILNADITQNHEHLPLTGHPQLISGARKLVFGSSHEEDLARIATIQTVSGTGSNHMGARLLCDVGAPKHVWISDPSWVNHTEVWEIVNLTVEQRFYPYFAEATLSLDFEGMLQTLKTEAIEGDVIILHACAHNPTGQDLSKEQWKIVADLCEEKSLIALFDIAYLEQDAWPIRHFFDRGLEFVVAQSFSKNFGLYGERVGALHVVTRSKEASSKVLGHVLRLQRAEITTPPSYGAKIVAIILSDKELFRQWEDDLQHMSNRMKSMRQRLYEELKWGQTLGEWEHIVSEVSEWQATCSIRCLDRNLLQIGMFSITGFSKAQVVELKEKYHIYLLPTGRISIAGLTETNVQYVASAFDEVIRSNS